MSNVPGPGSWSPQEEDRPQRGESLQGRDVLAGPADGARPSNPWPRLLTFFAVVAGALLLMGLCTVSFLNTPDREIRVRTTEFQPGTPKFLAVVSFGHDSAQMTFGAFLAVSEDASPGGDAEALALFSREPDSGCNLRWERSAPGTTVELNGGNFVDPCSDARYAFDGRALHDGATRNLHRFPVRREVTGYVVNFEEITLGECRGENLEGCSPPGESVTRDVPGGQLPSDFGTR